MHLAEDRNYIHLVEVRDRWWACVNVAVNVRVSKKRDIARIEGLIFMESWQWFCKTYLKKYLKFVNIYVACFPQLMRHASTWRMSGAVKHGFEMSDFWKTCDLYFFLSGGTKTVVLACCCDRSANGSRTFSNSWQWVLIGNDPKLRCCRDKISPFDPASNHIRPFHMVLTQFCNMHINGIFTSTPSLPSQISSHNSCRLFPYFCFTPLLSVSHPSPTTKHTLVRTGGRNVRTVLFRSFGVFPLIDSSSNVTVQVKNLVCWCRLMFWHS
jgi:hypothetical protein